MSKSGLAKFRALLVFLACTGVAMIFAQAEWDKRRALSPVTVEAGTPERCECGRE